ncbi:MULTISPECIES: cupin domain-containing protein [Dyadobacter]|uniref:Cupin domain-containing protein n=1 Tax=Dyadobacter chenhuakuii TaxID=2909339 RepID=A0ABY4XNB0_9BACT|nr:MULTISPECIES: cupin domain-containing protein [Dyadobacter]MCF2494807.1 cupin domain-containing protein [Dyadobacter chenhuakuii]MCF2519114.1 cupin domain-containing protein [Dyadobacter sp. CY351]USJ31873.1 cupin domain-containing protein [Dyadobacter chenhuakuii]
MEKTRNHIATKILLTLAAAALITFQGFSQSKADADAKQAIFPKGQQGPASNFTGKAFNYGLLESDSTYNTVVGNVFFEPGARSNWHKHPAGQILIITAGEGFHQIKGKPIEKMRKGDVVKCPPDVEHWHGASPDSGLHQMYIIPNTEKGIVEWLQPVNDKEYNAFK